MDAKLQEHLQQFYKAFDVPLDVLVTEPELGQDFANRLRRGASKPGMTTKEVMRLLLRLRKCGSLPRIRRGDRSTVRSGATSTPV